MRRERFDALMNQEIAGFDLAPMIDIVFLLLIFFVSTTVYVNEAGLKIEKPSASSANPQDKNSLQFSLDQQGGIYQAGQSCPLNSVRGLVHRKMQEQQVPVLIIADRHSTTNALIELMDEIKLGGASSISLAALNTKNP